MSFRKYLSELDGGRLAELLGDSNHSATEQAAVTGDQDLAGNLHRDLSQNYPGLTQVVELLWRSYEQQGATTDFMNGLRAGSLMVFQVVRLAAEVDDIADIPPS